MKMKPDVKAAFETYPEPFKEKLLALRQLILETAACIDSVGALEETLKWGEPSYLTPTTKSGSTIRLAWKAAQKEHYSIFFKCTADLVPAMKARFADTFNFGGNRSIDFELNETIPQQELKQCIALALTYHLNKKESANARWTMIERLISQHDTL